MNKDEKIYTKVYMTLARLEKNAIDKIPAKLRQVIFEKADTTYPYVIDELLPESKTIIAAIIKKYNI